MKPDASPVSDYARAAGIGVVAGLRSQLPLALISLAVWRGELNSDGPVRGRLRSPRILAVLGLSALGELVGDKLPIVPSRTAPKPLAGRVLFGGVAGTVLSAESGRSSLAGAALGGLGALLGSYAGQRARAALGRTTGVPDPVLGVVEDALALAIGSMVTRRD